MTLEEALARLSGVADRGMVEACIAQHWVRPAYEDEGPGLDEVDIARVVLVQRLRADMSLPDDAVEIVLHLLDQLYGLQEEVRLLGERLRLNAAMAPGGKYGGEAGS